jgi:hypothetical protein
MCAAPDLIVREDRLTAAREVSYRQWSGGVPFEGFYVELGFELPVRGQTVTAVGIGRDGDYVADPESRYDYNPQQGSGTESGDEDGEDGQ